MANMKTSLSTLMTSDQPRDDLVKMKHLHEKYFHAVRGYAVRASKDGQDDEDDETDEAEDDD